MTQEISIQYEFVDIYARDVKPYEYQFMIPTQS